MGHYNVLKIIFRVKKKKLGSTKNIITNFQNSDMSHVQFVNKEVNHYILKINAQFRGRIVSIYVITNYTN